MAFDSPGFRPNTIVCFYSFTFLANYATTPEFFYLSDNKSGKLKKYTGAIKSMYWDDTDDIWMYKVKVFSWSTSELSESKIIDVPERIIMARVDAEDYNIDILLEKFESYSMKMQERELNRLRNYYIRDIKEIKDRYKRMLYPNQKGDENNGKVQ